VALVASKPRHNLLQGLENQLGAAHHAFDMYHSTNYSHTQMQKERLHKSHTNAPGQVRGEILICGSNMHWSRPVSQALETLADTQERPHRIQSLLSPMRSKASHKHTAASNSNPLTDIHG